MTRDGVVASIQQDESSVGDCPHGDSSQALRAARAKERVRAFGAQLRFTICDLRFTI